MTAITAIIALLAIIAFTGLLIFPGNKPATAEDILRREEREQREFAAARAKLYQEHKQAEREALRTRPSEPVPWADVLSTWATKGAPGNLDIRVTVDADGYVSTFSATPNKAPNRGADLWVNGVRTTFLEAMRTNTGTQTS